MFYFCFNYFIGHYRVGLLLKQVVYLLCSMVMSALTVNDPCPGGPGGPGGPWTARLRPEPEPEVAQRC